MATIYKYPQWLMPENSNKDKVSNYSFEFDGINDQINLDSNIPFVRAGGQHFSISAWVYCNSSSQNGFFSTAVNASFAGQINLWKNGSRAAILNIATASTGNIEIRSSTAAITSNTWHHIVATFDGTQAAAADRVNMYVNGVLDNAYQSGTGTNLPSGSSLIFNRIGRTALGVRQNGKIDNLAIWDSTLTAGNVTTLYNSGKPVDVTTLSPPYAWKLGEAANFTDNWLVNNSSLDKYSTRSFNFDGVDDYIETTKTAALITASLSMWVKVSGNFGVNERQSLASNDDYNHGRDFIIADTPTTTNDAYIAMFAGAIIYGKTSATGGIPINDGNWHHLVWTYDGSAGTSADINMYVDGQNQYSNATYSSYWSYEIKFQYFGKPVAANTYFAGSMDEVAYFNSVLSASDVTSIYNSGTPTTITGASAHYRMGENATFSTNWTVPDQVGSNDGTSANMDLADLEGDAPNYTGGGLSADMTIEDRIGNAPNSNNNAVSYNMDEVDRETDVPS
jgi:hypothetical protein